MEFEVKVNEQSRRLFWLRSASAVEEQKKQNGDFDRLVLHTDSAIANAGGPVTTSLVQPGPPVSLSCCRLVRAARSAPADARTWNAGARKNHVRFCKFKG